MFSPIYVLIIEIIDMGEPYVNLPGTAIARRSGADAT